MLRRIELFPVVLEFAKVRRAMEPESEEIFARMEEMSAEMGTPFVRNGDCLLWQAGQAG